MASNPSSRRTAIKADVQTTDQRCSDDEIRLRAFELYQMRIQSNQPGDEAGDWVEAERQLRTQPTPRIGGFLRS